MSLVAPFPEWPQQDREMWHALTSAGNPLDDAGALSHLRITTHESLRIRYGRWIGWLRDTDPSALALPPPSRATMPRLTAWLDGLAHTRPMSRLAFVSAALRVLRAAAPDADWTAHRRLEAMLKAGAGRGAPERKAGRVLDSSVLLDAGLRLAGPEADAATTPLRAAKCRRDGAMIAMLAVLPIRRRAFANLEIGTSINFFEREILVSLPEDLMKTGVTWEAALAEPAASVLHRYVDDVRPWLMVRGGERHDLLWVGDTGKPYELNFFGARFGSITKRLTGVRVPPHFFKDAAATTLARTSPEAARLIRPILGHAGFRTAERHYIHARGIEAGRDYSALVTRLKKERS